MKSLSLLLLVSCLFISSCIDEEGKMMIMFVNQIVEKPDKMQEIIALSEYYDKEFTEPIDSAYWHILITSIKAYKNNGIQYNYEPDAIVNNRDGSQVYGKYVFISSGNIRSHPSVSFFFRYLNKKWILINVLWGY